MLLFCVYLLFFSFITSLIVSHRWQHIFTFVSAVDVSDSCTRRIKVFRNHIETGKYSNWNLMCQLCCIETICCRQVIVSEICSLPRVHLFLKPCLQQNVCTICWVLAGEILRRSRGASHMYIEGAVDWWMNEMDCPGLVISHTG
jgi:hypothetical protein